MKLIDLLENCYWDRHELSATAVNQVIRENYSDQELMAVTERLLRAAGSRHDLPGSVVATLWGIQDWWREYHTITPRQQVYVIQNLLLYWDRWPLESRISAGIT